MVCRYISTYLAIAVRAMVCMRFQSSFSVCPIFTSIPVTYSSERPILFLKSREKFAYCNKSRCRDAQTRAILSFFHYMAMVMAAWAPRAA